MSSIEQRVALKCSNCVKRGLMFSYREARTCRTRVRVINSIPRLLPRSGATLLTVSPVCVVVLLSALLGLVRIGIRLFEGKALI